MKKIIFSQRIDLVSEYGERRDCIDERLVKFIWDCGYFPVAINNISEKVDDFIAFIRPQGIILSGGNDLAKYGGNASERDEVERKLIKYSLSNNIPLYAFCRGMQMVADYFNNELQYVTGHVTKRHMIYGKNGFKNREVNSYHHRGILQVKSPLIELARASDGVIEAMKHENNLILCTMWHPERCFPYCGDDIDMIKELFGQ
ncbi:MAG: gamma-glutamyl-gamma-aminobutyrate hydrolase family protein [Lactobacillales bacterium]|jgi:putative glutamine amidotransferase|nr:gamma-glutamyl-gamma-aminobutyrate hydrolase family protein [Lactobacillales bacterium]